MALSTRLRLANDQSAANEPPLQAIYMVLGVAILLVAIRWLWAVGLPRLHGDSAAPI